MKIFNKLAFLILSVSLPLGAAHASILTGSFDISVYNGSGGDSSALNVQMSGKSFSLTTLLDITWYSTDISGSIEHDDGVSLYVDGLSILDASAPTTPVESVFSGTAGNYRLIYAAANGLPEVLSVDVPEPTILALLGLGLVGFGFTRRRNKA